MNSYLKDLGFFLESLAMEYNTALKCQYVHRAIKLGKLLFKEKEKG